MEDLKKEVEITEVKVDTKNPFNKGVSYADFLKNVKGNVTVKILLSKLDLTKAAKTWIEQELENYKQNNK
tara:strand:- start:727 stop:936 length:210 start_codon:yes stop_codon:yes gene_type:complete